ncbi:RNA-directed DNA polymerase from mobile element jockey [Elysia marginata]|uniref:RNA-directed DNA polymerase from mobile element jockey n=1 Tax=Elysia marginata TaxID=1093978 RepID=A0AAV4JB05_9GAST|nr:RNA-directed DNA polymerase from mobile element jockey [Elysia marginata]
MWKNGNKLWRLIGVFNGMDQKEKRLKLHWKGMETGKATADLLIKQYAAVSNTEVDPGKNQIRKNTKILKETPTDQEKDSMNKTFTQHELDRAIKNLKLEKSSGEDGVTNEITQHLEKNMKKKLLQLYNTTWTAENIPQTQKEAIMIPIYKQGKGEKKPENCRPVILLRCLGKSLERMVSTRMTWYLEKNNILIVEQEEAGFPRGRCTEDQITLIAQEIEDGFRRKRHTAVVLIDMEKTLDCKWTDGLLFKLKSSGICENKFNFYC